jgi:subtilisin-like proprotein convertase family protein
MSIINQLYNSKYFNLRVALVLLLLGGVSFVVMKSGAQDLKSSDNEILKSSDNEFKKPRVFINQDIRMTNPENLAAVIENFSAGRENIAQDIKEKATAQARAVNEEIARLKIKNPTLEITMSPFTGAVEVVRSSKTLTGANRGRDAKDIALDFIRANSKLYGLDDVDIENLHYVGESVNETSGLRLAIFEQKVNDRLVFQGEIKISLDRDGRIIQTLGNLIPKATGRAAPIQNLISPQDALVKTMAAVDIELDGGKMKPSDLKAGGLDFEIAANDERIGGNVTSNIVYFPVAPGILIPAWSQTIFGEKEDYYALADAADGTLLWRKNIRSDVSTHQARFRVYVQADGSTPADSPAPLSPSTLVAGFQPAGIAPTIVDMLTVQNIVASPDGWISDCPGGVCTANETQTLGNNTLVCMDRDAGAGNVCDTAAIHVLDGNGRPMGNPDAFTRNRDFLGVAPRDFQTNFLPAPQGGNPEAGQDSDSAAATVASFLRASAVQQFYVTNWYHDKLYALGFTPASRNFQNNNFGFPPTGNNDRVNVDVQDGQAVDNANFSTPIDGVSGRAQMFNFTGPVTTDRDGGLDAEILMHELTHGTSNRLIGNATGLQWRVGQGMGEGWSDFYALSLLNNTNADDPNLGYASGAYATYKAFGFTTYVNNYTYGIRRFPYHTNNTVNPMTWADVDDVTNNLSGGMSPSSLTFNNGGGMEVHNSGEIWALTLWEVRSRIIADPAGANGNVPTGNNTTLSIVTDAMRAFTPNQPSFIQARDALVDADCAANVACPNELSIWGGFADRGLGYNAVAPLGHIIGYVGGHMGVGESFETPNLDVNTLTVNDNITSGNNSGFIDPGETIRLTVNLRNPYRGAGRNVASATSTLTTSTPGVTIVDNSAAYGAIAAQGNANPSGSDHFVVSVPAVMACGAAIRFTITTNSTLGTASKNFIIRLGAPTGTSAPVTYTRNPSPDIAIPDNAPRGVGDSLTITDDFQIADLNFRMDSLTHTWVGDVSVMLKAPNGYGTDLIGLMGDGGLGGADQDNITNMLIDQTAVAPNDQRLITAASDPFTDDWLPIFNSPSWTGAGFPTDPVGQLTRYNGLSTLGTWNLRVADQGTGDTGTLNQWSLIVTPTNFVCSPFTPTAATVSVGGRVLDSSGLAVSRAYVTLTDSQGTTRTAITNPFGYYKFYDVQVGQNYVFSVSRKQYNFTPQVIFVEENMDDLNFTAESPSLIIPGSKPSVRQSKN